MEAFLVSEGVAIAVTALLGLRDPWLFAICAGLGIIAVTDAIFDPDNR